VCSAVYLQEERCEGKERSCVHFYKRVIEGVWIRIFFFVIYIYIYIYINKISDICCSNDINLKLVLLYFGVATRKRNLRARKDHGLPPSW